MIDVLAIYRKEGHKQYTQEQLPKQDETENTDRNNGELIKNVMTEKRATLPSLGQL